MVSNMTDLREQFFKMRGTNMINYFLNRSTDTSADLNYIAVKFLVYLSETAEFQHTVALKGSTDGNFKMFIDTIVGFSHKTEII